MIDLNQNPQYQSITLQTNLKCPTPTPTPIFPYNFTQIWFALQQQVINSQLTVILMNQTALRERKSSINRLSTINSTSKVNFNSGEAKKKMSSTKKNIEIQDICIARQGNRYLIGWGKIPYLDSNNNSLQIINKDVVCFSAGEEHIIFMNGRGELYGIGNNQYGQLGNRSNNMRNTINRVFEEINAKRIYCTEYATFIVNHENQLFACGLNNRGQLGFGTTEMKVDTLKMIDKLSEYKEEQLKRKNSRSRISSIYYQQMKRESYECQSYENFQSGRSKSALDSQQSIVDIRGGPLHTVALTSKGRLFYAGNFYKTSSLLEDQYSSEFIELNTSKLGKVKIVRSYITGFGFLTLENKLYILGNFGLTTYDEPFQVSSNNVNSFDINDAGIYFADSYGELYFISFQKESAKSERVSISEKIVHVQCGMDFTIAVNNERSLYGKGDNSQRQLSNQNQSSYANFHPLQLSLGEEEVSTLKCCNNFVLALTSHPPNLQEKVVNSSKIKDIERENKILKELLCNKNKKSVKIQTDKQSKFDIARPANARTFDTSLEIAFDELKLGKQISEGGYGIIYKATWRKSTVAVKIFKIEKDNDNAIRDFVSECHAMEALRHPNIVMFLGACTKPPHFAIVLEYCEGGTLWSLLQKQEELGWEERRRLALDTALGMNYLHERSVPVLHRDLKSLNLLLDHNRRIKLADFGWTKGLQNYMTGKIGTYQWMAPEVISGFQYTQKADVFSFGIILWEIASRQAPYRNIPGPQVAQEVLTKDLRPTIPKKTPEAFSELIRACWSKNAELRPSFISIIQTLQTMRLN